MKKLALAILLLCLPSSVWATAWTVQRTGDYAVPSGTASSPWYDNGAQTALNAVPVDGDTIDIPASGYTLTASDTQAFGAASGTLPGIRVRGTSGFIVTGTGVLTVKGVNGTYPAIQADTNATVTYQPGATIHIISADDSTNITGIINNGYFSAIGTAQAPITINGVPNWNNDATDETKTTNIAVNATSYIYRLNIWAYQLAHYPVSNAAGTGVGSFGDTSFTLSATPADNDYLASGQQKSSVDELASNGDWYLDHHTGTIYFKNTTGTKGKYSYKYLTKKGFFTQSPNDSNQSWVRMDYVTFNYGGSTDNATEYQRATVEWKSKTGANVAARESYLKNSVFNYCNRQVQLFNSTGDADHYIQLTGNTFLGTVTSTISSFGDALLYFGANASATGYINWANNTFHTIQNEYATTTRRTYALSHFLADGNTGIVGQANSIPDAFVASTYQNCVLDKTPSSTADGRGFITGGSAGNINVYQNNTIRGGTRCGNLASYMTARNNKFKQVYHHGFVMPLNTPTYITDIIVENNIIYDDYFNDMPGGVTLGYNKNAWINNVTVRNNTFDSGKRSLTLGDDGEALNTYITNLAAYNNIFSKTTGAGTYPPYLTNDIATAKFGLHFAKFDSNLEYGLGAAPATGTALLQAKILMGGNDYNLTTRNIPGVALYNPSSIYSGSRSLVYTVDGTLGTDLTATMTWGSGSATNILASATASAVQGAVASATTTTVVDSGKSWTTDQWMGKLCLLTDGTNWKAGFIRTNNGTTLTIVAPENAGTWTSAPTTDYKYVILNPHTVLADGTDTIYAGIDAATFRLTSATDIGISISAGKIAADPAYTSTTAGSEDFLPAAGSPAIDAGTSYNPASTDIAGTARPQNELYDIGAYETEGDAGVNGACGPNNGGSFNTLSSDNANNCATGTVTDFTGTGLYLWYCAGSGGGSNSDACTATINHYNVTLTAGANGSFNQSSPSNQSYGATPTFSVSPSTGYTIDTWGGTCGGSGSGNNYTTSAISADCTVAATFKRRQSVHKSQFNPFEINTPVSRFNFKKFK